MSIEQNILSKISKKVFELYDTVKEYESDTFSASGAEMTEDESGHIVVTLINQALQDMIDTNTLDGVALDEMLSLEREYNDEK